MIDLNDMVYKKQNYFINWMQEIDIKIYDSFIKTFKRIKLFFRFFFYQGMWLKRNVISKRWQMQTNIFSVHQLY